MLSSKKFAIWGDSVLKGIILNKQGRYEVLPGNCAHEIERIHDLKIENRSRFGCTITKGMQQLEQAIKRGLQCDYMILEYGGNDCDFDWKAVAASPEAMHQPKTIMDEFVRVYEKMIKLLKANSIIPVVVSLPPINGSKYLNFLTQNGLSRSALLQFLNDEHMIYRFHEAYSLAATNIAHRLGCLYAPVREAFLEQRNQPDLLCADGIHPNENGHKIMQSVFEKLADQA